MDYRRLKVPASQRRALMGENLYFKNFAEAKVGQIFASGYENSSSASDGQIKEFIELSFKSSEIISYADVDGYSSEYGWPIYDPRFDSETIVAYYKTSESCNLSKELEKNYLKVLLSNISDNTSLLRLTVISAKEELDINAEIIFLPKITSVVSSFSGALSLDGDIIRFSSSFSNIDSIEIEIE